MISFGTSLLPENDLTPNSQSISLGATKPIKGALKILTFTDQFERTRIEKLNIVPGSLDFFQLFVHNSFFFSHLLSVFVGELVRVHTVRPVELRFEVNGD